ncbi:MAG: metallopeptidase TldD-related protein [Pseudomonadota bacterium]
MSISAQEIAERCLREASSSGECIAVVDEVSSVHARFVGGQLTSSSQTQHRRLTLATLDGQALGLATRTGLDQPDALRSTVVAARANSAPRTEASPLVASDESATSNDWSAAPAQVGPDALAGVAAHTRATQGGTPHGFAEERVTTTYLATSTGLRLRHQDLFAVLDVSWRCNDADRQNHWTGALGTTLAGLTAEALRPVTHDLQHPTLRRAPLRTGRYDVILTPSCMADLAHHLYGALGAQDALAGQSPFADLAGDRLTHTPLRLHSDPHHPALPCAPFVIARGADPRTSVLDNGLGLKATEWIADGALKALVHTRESARRGDHVPTPAIDNLVLEGDSPVGDLAALIAGTERAILVNSLWYLRPVDRQRLTLTGLTRDGVYLIEGGEITAELPDFRFNESVLELLRRITAFGHSQPALPREWAWVSTRMAMPPVRVEGFDVTAVST